MTTSSLAETHKPTSHSMDIPQWFKTLKANATQKFQQTPTPTRKQEAWRFADLKQLAIESFAPAIKAESNDFYLNSKPKGLEQSSATFIFANNTTVYTKSELPEGVICLPLEDALQEHSELVQQYLLKQDVKLGSEKYAALHTANLSNGLFLYVPQGVEIEHPIEIYNMVSGSECSIFPHTLIVTEDNASVNVIEYFTSLDEDTHLVLAMHDLIAKQGSSLTYTTIQDLNLASKAIQIGNTNVGPDAHTKSFVLNVGASWARNESYSSLIGKGAHSDMLSLNIPMGEQHYDQRTFQHHVEPHTYSDLLYKNALYENSKVIFSGLITVDEGAHYTDAYQTCRNLLMEDTTEASSMPGLQINADQVKCSHGSTSSAIDDQEIFYLQARGIPAHQARQLIAYGFCVKVVEKLKNEALESLIYTLINKKFKALS